MNSQTFISDPAAVADGLEAARSEIAKVIVGQTELVQKVLIAVLCEGHLLLEGVPGLGKTRLLTTLGQVLQIGFGRISFTPDLMPADILGTNVLQAGEFSFHPGPVFTNLVLADEINRATPKTQSALLEAMAERNVTVAGSTRSLPRPFLVMATQNPLEMEGTYPLPEAQLDRFMLKELVPFPPSDDLVEILRRTTGTSEHHPLGVLEGAHLTQMSALVRELPAGKHLLRYASTLVGATHPDSSEATDGIRRYVRAGASPRGAQALVLGGKALALMDGRPNLSSVDIRSLAHAALRHRLVLGYEAVVDGVTADQLIDEVLAAHPEARAED
jgi:MoxR-like ATPase